MHLERRQSPLRPPDGPARGPHSISGSGKACARALLLTTLATLLHPALAEPPADWPPELAAPFALYDAGEFDRAADLARQIGHGANSAPLRRDAEALSAMCLMRSASRDDRLSGRTQLAALGAQDVRILDRPECLHAAGVVATSLQETAKAIELLREAHSILALRRDLPRLGAAALSLVEAWAAHSEWETPIRGTQLIRPVDSNAADAIRREQIRLILEQAAALGISREPLARIELVSLLIDERLGASPLQRLLQIADDPAAGSAQHEAALRAGDMLEREGRWQDAQRRWDQAKRSPVALIAEVAQKKIAAITAPELELAPPEHAANRGECVVKVRARNVSDVLIELRRIDLGAWLSETRGAIRENAAPTTGSVVVSSRYPAPADASYAWWSVLSDGAPPSFSAPAGAYALVASAAPVGKAPQVATRLFVTGAVDVTVIGGANRGVVWATSSDTALSAAIPRARMWVQGASAPMSIELTDGVGEFAWPAEARLSARPWVCWVEQDEQVAICRGVSQPPTHLAPVAAMVASPSYPRVGEALSIFGQIRSLDEAGVVPAQLANLRVELRDTLDSLRLTPQINLLPAGSFLARIAVQPAMSGKRLSGVAMLGDRVAEPLRGRFGAMVSDLDPGELTVIARAPSRLAPDERLLPLGAYVLHPWAPVPSDLDAMFVLRGLRLPAGDDRRTLPSRPWSRRARTLAGGRAALITPVSELEFDDTTAGPIAISMSCAISGPDGRQSRGTAYSMIGEERIALWIQPDSSPPGVGAPLGVSVKWFDPQGLAQIDQLRVTCALPDATVRPLALAVGFGGIDCVPIRAPAAGRYRFSATLPLTDGSETSAHLDVDVRPGLAGASFELAATRALSNSEQVRVRLTGASDASTLLALVSGEPLAAAVAGPFSRDAEVTLTAPRGSLDAQIVAYQVNEATPRLVVTCPVELPEQTALKLRIRPGDALPRPGGRWRFKVECERLPGHGNVTLLARLVDSADAGTLQWSVGESSEVAFPAYFSPRAFGASGEIAASQRVRPNSALKQGLFESATLWLDAQLAERDATPFQANLPAAAIRYRLVVLALAENGDSAVATETLDLRDAPLLFLDAPQTASAGDRFVLSARITNPADRELTGRLTLDAGKGLALEPGALACTPGEVAALSAGVADVRVAAGAELIVRFRAEAAALGRGVVRASLTAVDAKADSEVAYRVLPSLDAMQPSGSATEGVSLRFQRQVFILEREQSPAAPATEDEPISEPSPWLRRAPAPGERIAPGTPLLVQEDVECPTTLHDVLWRQNLPSNTLTSLREGFDARPLGALVERRLDRLEHRLAALPRRATHEYIVIAGRPGVCGFPAPEISAAGRALQLEATPTAPAPAPLIVADEK